MSQFKVGDKVRVKCIKGETRSSRDMLSFTTDMVAFHDRVTTITERYLAGSEIIYRLDIEGELNSYVAEWLELAYDEKIQLTTTELIERLMDGEKLVPSGVNFSDTVYCYYDANASGQPFLQQLKELPNRGRTTGMYSVWDNAYWTVYKETTEMSITEIEQALGVKNLKVVK